MGWSQRAQASKRAQEELRLDDPERRREAILALGKQETSEGRARAIPLLFQSGRNADERVRMAAALALWKVTRLAEGVPFLIELLRNEDSSVRVSRAHALGEMEQGATAAASALEVALTDGNKYVRSSIYYALSRQATPERLFDLAGQALADPSEWGGHDVAVLRHRARSPVLLATPLGPAPGPAGSVRVATAEWIWRRELLGLGQRSLKEVVPALVGALDDERRKAADLLLAQGAYPLSGNRLASRGVPVQETAGPRSDESPGGAPRSLDRSSSSSPGAAGGILVGSSATR